MKTPAVIRLTRHLSDEKVIVFSRSSLGIIVFLVLCSWLFVGLRLNQSSVGVWDSYFGAPVASKGVELGTPKPIRSDEWNTLTPFVLSQVAHGFPANNENVGAGWSPGLMGTPLSDATSLAQPKFWGFHWLPVEFGFSWSWAWKIFATALALFGLLLAVGESRASLALIGTLWIYGSSFTQWWFSNGLPEMIGAWCLSTLGGLYLLRAGTRAGIAFGGVLIAFSVCNMATYLYPAFQFPLATLAVTILIGVTAENDGLEILKSDLRWRILAAVIASVFVGMFAYHLVSVALPTIEAVMATEYPGHRVSLGGEMTWFRAFDGFFEGFRKGDAKYPLPPTNASEASNFVLMFPLVLFLVPVRAWLRRDQLLVVALFAYCLFVFAWMALPLPPVVSRIIASTGWSLSPSVRSGLGLGLASILLTMVVAARIAKGQLPVYTHAPIIVLSIGILVLVYGLYLRKLDPAFFHMGKLAAGTIATMAIAWGAARKRAGIMALGVVIFVWQPLQANPLLQGLDPVLRKPILLEAKSVTNKPGDKWMVVGSFIFSQGLKAQGLDVVTGSEYFPDPDTVAALDPSGGHRPIWNRYAHIVVASDPSAVEPDLKLVSPDMYVATLDVCGAARVRWGATLVAYTVAVPAADMKCLVPIPADPGSGVALFRFRS